jgi:hypothetical protein
MQENYCLRYYEMIPILDRATGRSRRQWNNDLEAVTSNKFHPWRQQYT